MTPANPDALADALAQHYREEHAYLRSTADEMARALVAGPLAPLLAELRRVTAERDEARARADGALAAGNDELRSLGTFDRKMKVGKHQATNRVHLRAVIAALDEAGLSEAADTLIWQAWHRVNSVARAHEFLRLANAEATAAEARAAQLQAEVEAVLDEATRMSSILLMAGEMTAQERRTARAVARGISLRVRTALAARAATAREGQADG